MNIKRKCTVYTETVAPCVPMAPSKSAEYSRWRIKLDDGSVVVRKFFGTLDEVLDSIWGAVSAVPIGAKFDA